MSEEDMAQIRRRAWVLIEKEQFDLAFQLIYGPMKQNKKQKPEMIAIYGCCSAVVMKKKKEGISMCKKAVAVEPNNSNIYFLLGLSYMTASLRNRAMDAFNKGLELNPHHGLIHRAVTDMGQRRKPPIPLLARDNPLNIMLGKKLYERKKKKKTLLKED